MSARRSKLLTAQVRKLRGEVTPLDKLAVNEVKRALKKTRNNKKLSAALLKISPTTLYRRLDQSRSKRDTARPRKRVSR